MPTLENLEDTANYTPADGEVVTFFAEEDGNIVLKAKKSDGTVENILEGN